MQPVLHGSFDVVVDAGRSQQSVRAALVDPDSRLRWQVVPAPAYAVVFQGPAHPVVGHGTVLKAEAVAATLSGWSLPAWQVTRIAPPGRGY